MRGFAWIRVDHHTYGNADRHTDDHSDPDTHGHPNQHSDQHTDVDATPGVVAPVITFLSPPNGAVTNQAAQTITNALDELATLTMKGDPVAVAPDL